MTLRSLTALVLALLCGMAWAVDSYLESRRPLQAGPSLDGGRLSVEGGPARAEKAWQAPEDRVGSESPETALQGSEALKTEA